MTGRQRQTWASATDIGRVRSHNEDSVLVSPPLFVVADGLGGHEAGEVASKIAVETLRDNAPRRADANALGRAVRAANREVIRAAKEGIGRSGMGTTITAAIVDGLDVVVAQVGDSRAYLLHDAQLTRITQDHSMVADMIRSGQLTEAQSRVHPHRSIITRALGTDPNMYADTFEVDVTPGDRLLLCSDGLTAMLTDEQIADAVQAYRDPATTAHMLIDAANEAGGQDNITVVVIDIEPGESRSTGTREGDKRIRGWLAVIGWILVAALAIAGIAYGSYAYARSRAFVRAESDGTVALYRGVPGEFAGISLQWRQRSLPIDTESLSPKQQMELRDGKSFEGLAAAEAYLAALSETALESEPIESETSPATTTP